MPKAPGTNDFQTTLKIPSEWLPKLDALAQSLSRDGLTVTRADALRVALKRGLEGGRARSK